MKTKKNKIIVTGATGFVGNNLVELLIKEKYEVIALVRNKDKAKKYSWFDKVEIILNDYHKTPLKQKFEKGTSLIHLAWNGLPNYNSLHHFEENLPKNYFFIKDLISKGVKDILVIGTCFEFGMKNGCISKNEKTEPNTPYSFAKDVLRKKIEFLKTTEDFTFKWARLFYMFGKGQNENSLIAQLDRAILEKKEFFNMSGGEQIRDYLQIEEIVKRILLVYNSNDEGKFNICSGQPISIRKLVEDRVRSKNSKIKLNLGYYD